jgi:hypothetical protein
LWEEILKQANAKVEKISISLPLVRDIAESIKSDNAEFIIKIMNMITDENVPERIRIDVNELFKVKMPKDQIVETNLLGQALVKHNKELTHYFKKLGVRMNVTNAINPVAMAFYMNAKHSLDEKKFCEVLTFMLDEFPELATIGDENGTMIIDDNNAFVHDFKPIHFIEYNDPLQLVTLLHERGVDLFAKNKTGETLLHIACRMLFKDIAQYILSNAKKEDILPVGKQCITDMLKASQKHYMSMSSHVVPIFNVRQYHCILTTYSLLLICSEKSLL